MRNVTPQRSATTPRTCSISAWTSSARPPLSAWMKLACFSDTCAVPSRKPFSPADSISRPAESSSGLVNTEPALAPPGWCSRRHLTMALTAACSTSTDPASSVPPASPTRSTQRYRTRHEAMSDPCPPAFMRTAPPTDPGTPTAHDSPDQPASATRRARTGSARAAPARTTGAAPAGSGSSSPAKPLPRCRTIPSKPSSDTSRLEPRPMTKIGAHSPAARSRRAARTTSRSAGPSTST